MAESIVKVPSTANGDFDFLGFSFAGRHSWDDFGIYRTSDGDRYNDELAPPMQDLTADVPGGDGQYYFGTFHKPKVFNVNFAFDNMSEVTYREMKKWLNGKEMGDLWFEEAPYKVYTAKVTGTPQMKSLCFDKYNEETERMERVYKGDGTIQFTAYWPYAHTPDFVAYSVYDLKANEEFSFGRVVNKLYFKLEGDTTGKIFYLKQGGNFIPLVDNSGTGIYYANSSKNFSAIMCSEDVVIKISYADTASGEMEPLYYYRNGKDLDAYQFFENRFQWKDASGLTEIFSQGENNGSLPAHFILRTPQSIDEVGKSALTFKVGDLSITVPAASSSGSGNNITYTHYESIEWDSKTGIVSAMVLPTPTATKKKRKPIPFTGNSLGAIPANSTVTWGLSNGAATPSYLPSDCTLEYHYWYY